MTHAIWVLTVFVFFVSFIIIMTAKVRMNAFLVLVCAAFGAGIASGLPPMEVVSTVTGGFGSILGYIGIVIIAGTIIGTILEKSRATTTIADTVLSLVGESRAPLAMAITGAVVSISVFCDSGFVILSSLNRTLARRTGASMSGLAVALSTGLYATHTFVPPTPGPIAAAGTIGADIGLVIILGLIVSVPAVAVGYLWSIYSGKKYYIDPGPEQVIDDLPETLPGVFASFAPVIIPIVLITLKSVADYPTFPFGEGAFKTGLDFFGAPSVALLLGVFLALRLIPSWREEYLDGWVGEGLRNAASIVMITGAGGAFGAVLKATDIGAIIGGGLADYNIGILLPFVIAVAFKTAQGSSTVAIITSAALVAPMLGDLGLASPVGKALTVMAVGSGAMIVSHANDSYFWVVSQFSGMDAPTAYKTHTVATALQGVTAMAFVWILAAVFA